MQGVNMEKLSETQRNSVSTIFNLLPQSSIIQSQSYDEVKVKDQLPFCGYFKAKIDGMLEKRNRKKGSIIFERFYYKRLEVGDITGQQLLDLLRPICRDKDLIQPRNCIIISINEKEEAAVVVLGENWLEITTPTLSGNNRGYYRKLFDDVQCKKLADERPNKYSEEVLRPLREDFPNVFKIFFTKVVMETSEPYRQACYGLLFDIAKLELEHPLYQMMRKLPVAALIWLAVFKGRPQRLQSLLGDHHLTVKAWAVQFAKENPHFSQEEVRQAISKKNFSIRTEAAYVIVAETLPMQQDGCYDNEELKRCVRDIHSFYGFRIQTAIVA